MTADDEVDLEALARRARHDPAAFGELFDRLHDPVYRYVRAQVANDALAEDLCGDVFLQALRSIDRYRPRGGGIRAWLFRIARNDVLDHFRRARRITFVAIEEADHAGEDTPHARALKRDEAQRLHRAISSLPGEQRDVVLLRFAGELRVAEIARILGKSEGAVKALQHRAVRTLAKRLKDDEG